MLKINDDDDKDFIDYVDTLAGFFVSKNQPKDVYVYKIKNWFDHKWLNFSGIGIVDFYANLPGYYREAALEEHWQETITIPPFNPNRIIEKHYMFRDGESYIETKAPKPLHKWQNSNNNLNRRIINYSNSGIFIWFSSNTKINLRGSIMIYLVLENHVQTFYLSLDKKEKWIIKKSKGINKEEIQI